MKSKMLLYSDQKNNTSEGFLLTFGNLWRGFKQGFCLFAQIGRSGVCKTSEIKEDSIPNGHTKDTAVSKA